MGAFQNLSALNIASTPLYGTLPHKGAPMSGLTCNPPLNRCVAADALHFVRDTDHLQNSIQCTEQKRTCKNALLQVALNVSVSLAQLLNELYFQSFCCVWPFHSPCSELRGSPSKAWSSIQVQAPSQQMSDHGGTCRPRLARICKRLK